MIVFRVLRKYQTILSRQDMAGVVIIIILMIIGGALEAAPVYLISMFLSMVMGTQQLCDNDIVSSAQSFLGISSERGTIFFIALVLVGVYVFKTVFMLLEYHYQYGFVYRQMFTVKSRLLYSYLHKPYDYFLGINTGEVIRIIGQDVEGTINLLISIFTFFTEITVALAIVAVAVTSSPVLVLSMTGAMAACALAINYFLHQRAYELAKNHQVCSAEMNKWIIQSVQGIKEIKVMKKESFFQEEFDAAGKEFAELSRKRIIYKSIPRLLIEGVSMVSFFTVTGVVILMGYNIKTIIPTIGVIGASALRLLPSVTRISGCMVTFSSDEPLLDKVLENLSRTEGDVFSTNEVDFGKDAMRRGVRCDDCGIISLNNVSFSYGETSNYILKDANLVIEKGDMIGIIGPSGAGKTTTVDIIMGLLRPQNGMVYVDGHPMGEDYEKWLSVVGYIPQSIFVLDDSICANVAFGISADEIDKGKVIKAIGEAALEEFVNGLPDGIETKIGERGSRVSGGQKQRIGIARALYYGAEVLILDEATSALDDTTESSIMEAINGLKGEKTLIIIAHRLSTIEKCDHVFRVENEKIINVR